MANRHCETMSLAAIIVYSVISIVDAAVVNGYDIRISRYGFLYIGVANVVIFALSIVTIVSVLVYRTKKQQKFEEAVEEEESAMQEKVDASARLSASKDNIHDAEKSPLLNKDAMDSTLPPCRAAISIGWFTLELLPMDKDSIESRLTRWTKYENLQPGYISAQECVLRLNACLEKYSGHLEQIVLVDVMRRPIDTIKAVVEAARIRCSNVKVITARQAQIAYAMNAISGNPENVLMLAYLPQNIEAQTICRRNGTYVPNSLFRCKPKDHFRIHQHIQNSRPSVIIILSVNDVETRERVTSFVNAVPPSVQCVIKFIDHWRNQFAVGGLVTLLHPNLVADITPGIHGTVIYGGRYEEVCFLREGFRTPVKVVSGFRRSQQVQLFYDSGIDVAADNRTPRCRIHPERVQLNGDPDQVLVEIDANGIMTIPQDAQIQPNASNVVPAARETTNADTSHRIMVVDLVSGQSLVHDDDNTPDKRWHRALSSSSRESVNGLVNAVEYLIRASRSVKNLLLYDTIDIQDKLSLPESVDSTSFMLVNEAVVYFALSKIFECGNLVNKIAIVVIERGGKLTGYVLTRSASNIFKIIGQIASVNDVTGLDVDIVMVIAFHEEVAPIWIAELPEFNLIHVVDWEEMILKGGLYKLTHPDVLVCFASIEQSNQNAITNNIDELPIPDTFVIELDLEKGCCLYACYHDGRKIPIEDNEGRQWTPLYLSVATDIVKTGYSAKADLVSSPGSVIHGILPFIGLRADEVIVENAAFRVRALPDGSTFQMRVTTGRGPAGVTQEHFIGANLNALRIMAQSKFGSNINVSIVRVPSKFGPAQYVIIKEAGEYAKLGPFKIQNVAVNND